MSRAAQALADLAAAIRAVPVGFGDNRAAACTEVFARLESAVNEGAIPDVNARHLSAALGNEERDERERLRSRNERPTAAKLTEVCRARLGDWIACNVRTGEKVTARGVLMYRAAGIQCTAIAEFVRAALDDADEDVRTSG